METRREEEKKMEMILQAVAALDICVNSYCLYYAKRTFNTKQVLNHILCIDAILTFLSCLVIFIAYFMETMEESIEYNELKCFLLSSIYFIVPTLFLLYNFITAFIRYKRISTAMNIGNWKTEDELIRAVNTILMATSLVLFLIILIDTQLDFSMIGYFDQCLENTAGNTSIGSFLTLTLRNIIVLCTVYFDLKCLRLVRSCRNQLSESNFQFPQHAAHRHILYEIPMRATIINGCLMLTAIFVGPMVITSGEEFKILSKSYLFIFLVKTPLMILLTFRVNVATARVDQDEERERLRQVEVAEAQQKRIDRLTRNINHQVTNSEILPRVIQVAEVPDTICHF